MKNDKSPGNDDLTKEFYETLWNPFFQFKTIFLIEELSTSQKYDVIKLIEKRQG